MASNNRFIFDHMDNMGSQDPEIALFGDLPPFKNFAIINTYLSSDTGEIVLDSSDDKVSFENDGIRVSEDVLGGLSLTCGMYFLYVSVSNPTRVSSGNSQISICPGFFVGGHGTTNYKASPTLLTYDLQEVYTGIYQVFIPALLFSIKSIEVNCRANNNDVEIIAFKVL